MLRKALLRVGDRRMARVRVARPNSIATVKRVALQTSCVGKRLFSSQSTSDPRKHPRQLDDDFEVVDGKNAMPNAEPAQDQAQLPLIFDVDPDTFNEIAQTAPMPLVVLFHIPGYDHGHSTFFPCF